MEDGEGADPILYFLSSILVFADVTWTSMARQATHQAFTSFTGGTDPRTLRLHRLQPQRDVPYVPTDEAVVAAMLKLAEVSSGDVVYDLGCGDGRIVIAAAKMGARSVGVDIDLQRVHEAVDNVKRRGLSSRVKILRESFFDIDLREASVVMLYLLPGINVKLRPKLLWELRPGTRIVSNNFEMGDWGPDATESIHHRTLYKWIVPAWVQGDWRCVIDRGERRQRDGNGGGGAGGAERRRHMQLHLRRHYQVISGTARFGRNDVVITDGRIRGDQLSFTLWHAQRVRPPVKFVATVAGNILRGTCRSNDGPPMTWGGLRAATPTDPRLH
jgi:precorrin-6B methylase 2